MKNFRDELQGFFFLLAFCHYGAVGSLSMRFLQDIKGRVSVWIPVI